MERASAGYGQLEPHRLARPCRAGYPKPGRSRPRAGDRVRPRPRGRRRARGAVRGEGRRPRRAEHPRGRRDGRGAHRWGRWRGAGRWSPARSPAGRSHRRGSQVPSRPAGPGRQRGHLVRHPARRGMSTRRTRLRCRSRRSLPRPQAEGVRFRVLNGHIPDIGDQLPRTGAHYGTNGAQETRMAPRKHAPGAPHIRKTNRRAPPLRTRSVSALSAPQALPSPTPAVPFP